MTLQLQITYISKENATLERKFQNVQHHLPHKYQCLTQKAC